MTARKVYIALLIVFLMVLAGEILFVRELLQANDRCIDIMIWAIEKTGK